MLSVNKVVALVARREISIRMRSRSYLISTILLLLVAFAAPFAAGLMDSLLAPAKIAVVPPVEASLLPDSSFDTQEVADTLTAESLLRGGQVEAIVVALDQAPFFRVTALRSAPQELLAALSVFPEVLLLEEGATDPILAIFTPVIFGLLLLMPVTLFGTAIAQSIVEEKQNRVIEIVSSAVEARAVLWGKILGISTISLAQMGSVAAGFLVALTVSNNENISVGLMPSIVTFLLFFVVCFLLFSSLYAAAAALVSRQEDLAPVTVPVTLCTMVPYFVVFALNGNSTMMSVLSYIPFSAPIAMPVRVLNGGVEPWEILVSVLLLLVAFIVAAVLASNVYRSTLLRTGSRVRWREIVTR